jgi:branched-chain amino acid transport system permease protein
MLFQLIISGVALGSIYALLALSVVLICKATDTVNFAQGEMAMFGTFLAFVLVRKVGMPLWLVLLMALPIGLILGGVTERIAIQPMLGAPLLNILIASLGLWMIFHYSAGWIWGYDPMSFPSLLPQEPVNVFGVLVSPNQLAIISVSFAVMLALFLFFEYTREGTAMRAASMNPKAAQLMGIRVPRVWRLSWMAAGVVGVFMGILVAPITFLDVDMMFTILLKGFAGAVLGGFMTLTGAVLGGMIIGIADNLIGFYISMAFKDSFSFLVIIGVLMFRPSGLLGRVERQKT